MHWEIACASGSHHAPRAFQSAIIEFEPKKTRFIDRAGKGKPKRMAPGKTERLIIRRIADEQDGAMPSGHGTEQSFPHEPAAKPARTISLGDRQRPEQKSRHIAGSDLPQPQGADEFARVLCNKCETRRGQAALTQTLHGLIETRRAESRIKQIFAGLEIGRLLIGDKNIRCGDSANECRRLHGIVRNQGHLSLRRPYRDARDDPRTVPGLDSRAPAGRTGQDWGE